MKTTFSSFWLQVIFIVFLTATKLINADSGPFQQDSNFNNETYGSFPIETFRSTVLVAPRINIVSHSPLCDDGLYTFFAPYGPHVENPGPTIMDQNGRMVWKKEGFGRVYNFKPQRANGKSYLTFWTGDDTVKGHGAGEYHVYDEFYNEVRVITAGNNLASDHHEFILTEDGHAIFTIYTVLKVDMTPDKNDATVGWIWDCLFQEVNIETNEVLFEWRASEHFTLADVSRPVEGFGTEDKPLDWFHINSIDKDDKHNYLVSARYTHAAHYIEGSTGNVLWNLGGVHNSFKDLSGGRATTYVGQHDVRWIDNYSGVSLFDNSADWNEKSANQSRGVRIKLNIQDMTATLVAEYKHTDADGILSESQGSMQVLPNGNVLLGYGVKGAWSEFDAGGKVLCHQEFESKSDYDRGDAQSYRVIKSTWIGHPLDPPAFVVDGEVGFVSWNGATEVDGWIVQIEEANARKHGGWRDIKRVKRAGFETAVGLSGPEFTKAASKHKRVRIAAVDKTGLEIGASDPQDLPNESGVVYLDDKDNYESPWRDDPDRLGLPIILVACVGTAALLWGAYELVQRRGGTGKGYRLLA